MQCLRYFVPVEDRGRLFTSS